MAVRRAVAGGAAARGGARHENRPLRRFVGGRGAGRGGCVAGARCVLSGYVNRCAAGCVQPCRAELAAAAATPRGAVAQRLSRVCPDDARKHAALRRAADRPCDVVEPFVVGGGGRKCRPGRLCALSAGNFDGGCRAGKPTQPLRHHRRRLGDCARRHARIAQPLPDFVVFGAVFQSRRTQLQPA